jgi:cilia- and flagella-associated protein 251
MRSKLENALTKEWAFGFQNRIINGVVNLTDRSRNAIFYISSHSGVIYDFENRTQTVLEGHRDVIKCCVVSKDRNFIVTCDSGNEPTIVIWDSRSGAPIKTVINAHAHGIDAVDISDDCLFITTLGINSVSALTVTTESNFSAEILLESSISLISLS